MNGFPSIYSAAAAAAKSLQSCPTLCDPMHCSPPGSSVHGIFQARVLEWGAIAVSPIERAHTHTHTHTIYSTRMHRLCGNVTSKLNLDVTLNLESQVTRAILIHFNIHVD